MLPEDYISGLGVWQEGRSSPLLSVMGVPMRVDQKGPEYLRNRVDVGLVRSSRRKKTPPLEVQLQRELVALNLERELSLRLVGPQ